MATLVLLLGWAFVATLFVIDSKYSQKTLPGLWVVLLWCIILLSRDPSYWFVSGSGKEYAVSVDSYESGNEFNRNVYFILILYGISVLIRRRLDWADLARRNSAMLIFFGYCLVSIFWSDYQTVAFKSFFKAIVGNVVMVLIILTDPLPLEALKKVMRRAAFVVMPMSIICIKYFPGIGRSYNRLGVGSFQGITNDSNALSTTCYIGGLAIIWSLIQKGATANKTEFRIDLLLLAMTFYLVSKGDGATAVVSMFFGGVLLALYRFNLGVGKIRSIGRNMGLVLIVSAPILIAGYSTFLNAISDVLGHSETLWSRYDLWTNIFPLVPNSLVGAGFGSFWLGSRMKALWDIYWWHPTEAHNGYVEIYITLGYIGLTLFGIVISTACRKATNSLLKPGLEPLKLAYLLPVLLYNLTEAGFRTLHPVWFLFLVAAIETPFIMQAITETSPIGARASRYPGIGKHRARLGGTVGAASR